MDYTSSIPAVAAPAIPHTLGVLLVVAFLAWVLFQHVPRWVKILLGLVTVAAVFPTDPLSGAVGEIIEKLLPSLLVLSIMVLGFRIMLGLRHKRPVFCQWCGRPLDRCTCKR